MRDPAPADIRDTPWHRFVVEIDEELATGRYAYTWAADTLAGIRATIERQQRVSAAQRVAVARIVAVARPRRRRRYV